MKSMNTEYLVYGDESVSNNIVSYGVFACPPSHYLEAIEVLNRVKINFMGNKTFPLHARILFSEDQRRKNNCAFLNDEIVFDMYSSLFDMLDKRYFKKIIVIADKRDFPKREIDMGGKFRNIKICDKSLIAFCANISLLPFAHIFGTLKGIKFFADKDKTKIDWLGRR
jgi:hypothetical protein